MTSDDPAPETPKQKTRWKLMLLVAVVVTAGIIYLIQDSKQRNHLAALNQAVQLKNSSLGHLENSIGQNGLIHAEIDQAEAGFRKVAELIPDEPLGLRNLAVTYLVKLKSLDRVREKDLYEETVAAVQRTLSELKVSSEEESTVAVLEANFHEILEEREEAISSFREAEQFNNFDAISPYRAFELMQIIPENYSVQEREEAIRSAYERAPRNLAIVIAYLKFLAETGDLNLSETLKKVRPLFTPLSSRVRDTLAQLLDKAAAAAEEGDWKTVQTQLGFTGNLMLAEIAFTNDKSRLNPHPLEFVQIDFSHEFYEKNPFLRIPNPSPVTVRFDVEDLAYPPDVTALALADLSFDGGEDLVVAHGQELSVYQFTGSEQKPVFSMDLPITVTGIIAADLDRDYQLTADESMRTGLEGMLDTDLDLIVWGAEGLAVLQNEWDIKDKQLKLSPVPLPERAAELTAIRDVAIADLDHDGDLDFAVVSQGGVTLWSNNGNWTFEDFTQFSQMPEAATNPQSLLPVDLNRNILNDFLTATDAGLFLSVNNLHGRYSSRRETDIKPPVTDVAILDVNRDACWDIITAGPDGLQLMVAQALQFIDWEPVETVTISKTAALGVDVWDFNNDGFDDVVAWNETGIEIFAGGPNNDLTLQSDLSENLPGGTHLCIADTDQDGDQDFLLLSQGQLKHVVNDGGNANHWIDIRLRAEEIAQTARERCNMHGVGNLVELKSGKVYQSRIVRGPVTHFGLGRHEQADVIRVVWTNTIPHNILSPNKNGVIFEQQHLKSSCPYLYTWDGEKFVFANDCLWASPIGLQFAQGILAPAREWEYLKIPADILQPRDGEYVLQMTEELWEAAYFDSVKLMAVDHPAQIDVFTNEKVGPAEIAEFKVHTAANPLQPQSLVDQQGRDLKDQTRSADGIYTKSWDRAFTQGLTETHWLELDLGQLENPSQIKLFLTGWVFPTDTSLNIAISQNPEKPKPQPPALYVPDENGQWQEVAAYVGFPGGKTKTIVIDLSDKFLTEDYRVRLVTNMEIRWDHVFFTVDEPDSEYELTDLTLKAADLHYRGFSARIPRDNNQHENYDYGQVNERPLWPPMGGHFTRYGEVTGLIRDADDLQVVMGAGDEMTVRFTVPEKKLPDGWVRDFILYNIGWDKDADLNTVQGQQVEPLPFRAMHAYPYEPEQSFPDTPKHRDYLKTYQTRLQARQPFRTQIRDWKTAQ